MLLRLVAKVNPLVRATIPALGRLPKSQPLVVAAANLLKRNSMPRSCSLLLLLLSSSLNWPYPVGNDGVVYWFFTGPDHDDETAGYRGESLDSPE